MNYKVPEIKAGQVWEWVRGNLVGYGRFRITSVGLKDVHYKYDSNDILKGNTFNRSLDDFAENARLVEDVEDKPNGQRFTDIIIDEFAEYGGIVGDVGDNDGGSWTVQDLAKDEQYGISYWLKPDKNVGKMIDFNFPIERETKMEKPKTKLEKDAVKEGKNRYIEDMMTQKANEAKRTMVEFVSVEREARRMRKRADILRDVLGVTDAEMKQIFE